MSCNIHSFQNISCIRHVFFYIFLTRVQKQEKFDTFQSTNDRFVAKITRIHRLLRRVRKKITESVCDIKPKLPGDGKIILRMMKTR